MLSIAVVDDEQVHLPFRENIKNIRDLLLHVYKIDKTYYLLDCIRLLLDAVGGALAVVLSADILEMLYEARPMEQIMKAVILLLALPTLAAVLSSVLWHEFVEPGKMNIARVYDGNLAAKFQSMDYSLVNSPYVKDMQDRIDKAHGWGAGIYDLFWKFDSIVSGILNLCCSLVVAYPILKIIIISRNMRSFCGMNRGNITSCGMPRRSIIRIDRKRVRLHRRVFENCIPAAVRHNLCFVKPGMPVPEYRYAVTNFLRQVHVAFSGQNFFLFSRKRQSPAQRVNHCGCSAVHGTVSR